MNEAERRKREQSRQRANLIWAICHPSRRRILRRIIDDEAPRSATELAKALGLSPGGATYHLEILHRFGAVQPTDEEAAHGPAERPYASTIADDPPIEALLEETREVDEGGGVN